LANQQTQTGPRRSQQVSLDGQDLKQLVQSGLAWLQHHQAAINTLNVYPVPDGDTGTNMVLTMQSAWAEIAESPETAVGEVAHKAAHGALMGARGNSGVILSQILRGFARGLDGKPTCTARDLAAAYREASATAYKGVVKPVEGTILTVARAVAEEAEQAVEESDDILQLLERVVFAAHETVLLTPSLLPVLREAGVVDAGGQGYFTILEGMLHCVRGDPLAIDEDLDEAVDLLDAVFAPEEAGYGYDVQFLIVGEQLDVESVRQRITAMGESALVVGEPSTAKVHVHVPDPGVPISYGASLGSLRDVVVEDMQAQYQDFIAAGAGPSHSLTDQKIGVVVVTQGDGLADIFRSLGAGSIVSGGQTMNPSTKDLLEAIEALPAESVIILPNNSNVILAAEQACSLSEKPVRVVPTRFVPEGVAAILALNPQGDLDENVASMAMYASEVVTGEVTAATRSVRINGLNVDEGHIIGLLDGDLRVSGASVQDVVMELLAVMRPEEGEIITVYYGEDVEADDAAALSGMIEDQWPEQEVECVFGGQPHYYYVLSVE
jgi:hypothetical protein